METFKVFTKSGSVYSKIKSWQKWDLNENFLVFKWGDSGELIIPFDDIKSIEKN